MTTTEAKPLIDVPEVLADLQAIVAEKGDGYDYTAERRKHCEYVTGGQPSCIVGHVLARHNLLGLNFAVSNEALTSYGYYNADEWCDSDAPVDIQLNFTCAAARVLAAAQSMQDSWGNTWGDALIAAKEAAEGTS